MGRIENLSKTKTIIYLIIGTYKMVKKFTDIRINYLDLIHCKLSYDWSFVKQKPKR